MAVCAQRLHFCQVRRLSSNSILQQNSVLIICIAAVMNSNKNIISLLISDFMIIGSLIMKIETICFEECDCNTYCLAIWFQWNEQDVFALDNVVL